MFKHLNRGISAPIAITIIVISAVIFVGGVFAYQYWWLPKEESNSVPTPTPDETAEWICGSPLIDSRDGKTYNTVLIGEQCWMAENLDYNNDCSSRKSPLSEYGGDFGWCGYYEGGPFEREGLLYQWSAAAKPDTCPNGWHLPTDEEYKILEMSLGLTRNEVDLIAGEISWRGTTQGDQLKAPNLCTGKELCSTSGFNAIFTGSLQFIANPNNPKDSPVLSFDGRAQETKFWSASGWNEYYSTLGYSSGLGFGRELLRDESKIYWFNDSTSQAFSVRCLLSETKNINADWKIYRGVLASQYEGLEELFYEFEYPPKFSVESFLEGRELKIKEITSGTVYGTIKISYEGGRGFVPRDYWNEALKKECLDCKEISNLVTINEASGILTISNSEKEWIIFSSPSSTAWLFVAEMKKPANEIEKLLSTFKFTK